MEERFAEPGDLIVATARFPHFARRRRYPAMTTLDEQKQRRGLSPINEERAIEVRDSCETQLKLEWNGTAEWASLGLPIFSR